MAATDDFKLETERLILSPWAEADREAVVSLYADLQASRDFGRVLRREESEKTFERYLAAFGLYGFTRWKLTLKDGTFIGTTGLMRVIDHQALGTHDEIGWRLLPAFWGKGYATEAARAAQADAQTRCDLRNIITYTAPDNRASQAVMERLGYIRAPQRDFSAVYDSIGEWHGWVWVVPELEV